MNHDVRASRRPMPRQLDVSEWNFSADRPFMDNSRSSTTVSASSSTSRTPNSSTARSAMRPINRYDSPERVPSSSTTSIAPTRSSRLSEFTVSSFQDIKDQFAATERRLTSPQVLRIARDTPTPLKPDTTTANAVETDDNELSSYLARRARAPLSNSDVGESSTSRYGGKTTGTKLTKHSSHTDGVYRSERDSQELDSRMSQFVSPFRARNEPLTAKMDAKQDTRGIATHGRGEKTTSENDQEAANRESVEEQHSTRQEVEIEPLATSRTHRPVESRSNRMREVTFEVESDASSVSEQVSAYPDARSSTQRATTALASATVAASPIVVAKAHREPPPHSTAPSSKPSMKLAEQRTALYAFRKTMRETFCLVEEMMDVHRDLFQSNFRPSRSGMPVYDRDVAQQAQELAERAFGGLTSLRSHFHRLTLELEPHFNLDDEQQSETRERREEPCKSGAISSRPSTKNNDMTSREQSSVVDLADIAKPRLQRPRSHSTSSNGSSSSRSSVSQDGLPTTHSHRSSPDVKKAFESTPSIASSTDELPHHSNSADDNNVFDAFDKRMEEIRRSLHGINARHTTRSHTESPSSDRERRQTTSSPATTAALQSRSSRDNQSSSAASREAQLRQLLQQLRQSNSDTDNTF